MKRIKPKIRKQGTIRFYVKEQLVNEVGYYHRLDMNRRIKSFTKQYEKVFLFYSCYYIISPLIDDEKVDYVYEKWGMEGLIKSNMKSYRGRAQNVSNQIS